MIKQISKLLFLGLMLVINNQAVADMCGPDDLGCQKVQAMQAAGIKPLATAAPHEMPEANASNSNANNANDNARPFEVPAPVANNRVVINPGLELAPVGPSLNAPTAAKAAYPAPSPNINMPSIPAPRLEALKPALNSGATPEIKPVGGSAINIPPGQQVVQSIYR